jgi:hypothetical protein
MYVMVSIIMTGNYQLRGKDSEFYLIFNSIRSSWPFLEPPNCFFAGRDIAKRDASACWKCQVTFAEKRMRIKFIQVMPKSIAITSSGLDMIENLISPKRNEK